MRLAQFLFGALALGDVPAIQVDVFSSLIGVLRAKNVSAYKRVQVLLGLVSERSVTFFRQKNVAASPWLFQSPSSA